MRRGEALVERRGRGPILGEIGLVGRDGVRIGRGAGRHG